MTSLTMSSPSPTNQSLSIAVTKTIRSSLPPADLGRAVQEAAQPWEPCFAPQETAPATVRCLLSRKPPLMTIKREGLQQQRCPQVLSNGVRPVVMSGGIKAVVTIRCAEREATVTRERAGGSITSQVSLIWCFF